MIQGVALSLQPGAGAGAPPIAAEGFAAMIAAVAAPAADGAPGLATTPDPTARPAVGALSATPPLPSVKFGAAPGAEVMLPADAREGDPTISPPISPKLHAAATLIRRAEQAAAAPIRMPVSRPAPGLVLDTADSVPSEPAQPALLVANPTSAALSARVRAGAVPPKPGPAPTETPDLPEPALPGSEEGMDVTDASPQPDAAPALPVRTRAATILPKSAPVPAPADDATTGPVETHAGAAAELPVRQAQPPRTALSPKLAPGPVATDEPAPPRARDEEEVIARAAAPRGRPAAIPPRVDHPAAAILTADRPAEPAEHASEADARLLATRPEPLAPPPVVLPAATPAIVPVARQAGPVAVGAPLSSSHEDGGVPAAFAPARRPVTEPPVSPPHGEADEAGPDETTRLAAPRPQVSPPIGTEDARVAPVPVAPVSRPVTTEPEQAADPAAAEGPAREPAAGTASPTDDPAEPAAVQPPARAAEPRVELAPALASIAAATALIADAPPAPAPSIPVRRGSDRPAAVMPKPAPASARTDEATAADDAALPPMSPPPVDRATFAPLIDRAQQTLDAAGPPTSAELPVAERAIDQKIAAEQDGLALDRLAREIARTAAPGARLAFEVKPDALGVVQVELQQSDRGAAIRLTAETEQSRQILLDAQPRLQQEARAQGLRIAETHVDLGGGQGQGAAQHQPGQQPGGGSPQHHAHAPLRSWRAAGSGEPQTIAAAPLRRGGTSDRFA